MARTGDPLVTRLRRRAARLIYPGSSGSEAAGIHRGSFYPEELTCQISGLSHLLELFVGRRQDGVFVEVGAYDGRSFSNTWGLAVRGWRGVMAEPVPAFAAKASRAHARHHNVRVVQTAVGAEEGTLTLVTSGPFTSANVDLNREYGSNPWIQNHMEGEALTVPMTTLTKLLAAELPGVDIDVLVVDVEGFESEVFAGYDWATSPKVLIVELSETHPDLRSTRVSDALLMRDIARRGYDVVYKDSINTVFVRDDVWESAVTTG